MWIDNNMYAQDIKYVKVSGDTYVMDMIKDWDIAMKELKRPELARRKIQGYDTTCRFHVRPHTSEKDLGSSISVMEYLDCHSYREIQQQDSISNVHNERVSNVRWKNINKGNVKKSVDVIYKATAHPETGIKSPLLSKSWYVEGKRAVYVINFTCQQKESWDKWMPEAEKLVYTLKEK